MQLERMKTTQTCITMSRWNEMGWKTFSKSLTLSLLNFRSRFQTNKKEKSEDVEVIFEILKHKLKSDFLVIDVKLKIDIEPKIGWRYLTFVGPMININFNKIFTKYIIIIFNVNFWIIWHEINDVINIFSPINTNISST